MKYILSLFFYVVIHASNNGIWVNSVNHRGQILLSNHMSKKYNVIWEGGFLTLDNNFLVSDGRGKIVFIDKKSKYRTLPQSITIKNGQITDKFLTINFAYKCVDSNCSKKELKGNFQYKILDNNKTINEQYTFVGRTVIKDNKVYPKNGIVKTNSSVYQGDLKNYSFNGYGIFKTEFNNKLNFNITQEGIWQNGEFVDGYMDTVYLDGGRYRGESKDGLPNGKGIFIWPDGSKYNGFFKNAKKNGYGVYTFSDGSIYQYLCQKSTIKPPCQVDE